MHCWFGKITGIWYSLQCKYCIFLKLISRKPTKFAHFRPRMVKKNPENRLDVYISDQIHILKPRKTTNSFLTNSFPTICMQFGWSVLDQKLPQWTLKAISDQLISDHCVVGFRPEAHPMDPESHFRPLCGRF